jgi:chromosome segregation ATPase
MSESAPLEQGAVERELEGLERAVGALLDELADLRRRAESAEARSKRLEQSVRNSERDATDPAALERRLGELREENARLNAVIEQARERATRIRSRLLVIEDEAND